jgi:hypothetical protein
MTADYPGLVQALQSKHGLSTQTSGPRQQHPDMNQTT